MHIPCFTENFEIHFENSAVFVSQIATRPRAADTMVSWGTGDQPFQPFFYR